MSPIKNQLIEMIDILPEQEQILLLEIAKRFVPDDVATPDDVEAINKARDEYKRGETVGIDQIDWN